MTPASILAAALARGVQLSADDGELCIRAPKGALTPELREELARHKPAILEIVGAGRRLAAVSYAQQRLWFFDQLEPNASTYNMYGAYRLTGSIDGGAVESALNGVIARHESLRTSFMTIDGGPVQVIAEAQPIEVRRVDSAGDTIDERVAFASAYVAELAHTPFALDAPPLIRAALIRLADDDHVLAFVVHHIVSDGWSLRIIMREFSAHYAALVRGTVPDVPALTLHYADFARKQRVWLESDQDAQLSYWRSQLEGVPPLELPTDRPRPAMQTFTGGQLVVHAPRHVVERVKAIGREDGATPFMSLLAVFHVLLARLTGQEDITVGTPISGRNIAGTESLVGFFGNTLALRVTIDGDLSYRDVVRRVRTAMVEAMQHQDLPFEQLVAAVQPERDMSRTPIFQVVFNMANFSEAKVEMPGLDVELLSRPEPEAKFDLTLYVKEVPDGIRIMLVYNRDLFDASTMEHVASLYGALLDRFASEPDAPVWRVPVLEADVRARRAVNPYLTAPATFVKFPATAIEQSLVARFESEVRLHGHRIAIDTGEVRWTYEELNSRANRAAHALLAAGLSPGDRVALYFTHGAAMTAGMLGALKAGLVYVPLDPAYPRSRLEYMLEDSGASAILSETGHGPLVCDLPAQVPILHLDSLTGVPDHNPGVTVSASSLAYILYTSGSTGQPKGVMQSHGNVLHFIRVYTNNLGIAPEDRVLLLASYAFDAAVMDIYGALLNGATLIPYSVKESGLDRLAEFMAATQITIYHSTPTVFRYFCATLQSGRRFPAVRLVVLGGEEARRTEFESFQRHFRPEAILINGLGPTESTVTLQYFVPGSGSVTRASLPAGFPVENTDILLVNSAGADTELFGEIAIRSRHVALGYWNKPEQTSLAFSEDAQNPSLRIYRTGDLGRRLPDGSIEFIGRRDFQIKIRGHRVEPLEVEFWLCRHDAVKECAVVGRTVQAEETLLAAYVVLDGRGATVAELQEHLRSCLPDYMVPSAILFVDALPLTPTGKIDRRALPTVAQDVTPRIAEDANPRTPTEEIIASIWCDVLGLDYAGVQDRFFDLGGHSLKATQVMGRVRAAFGVDVPLRAMFETPTIAALAQRVDRAMRDAANTAFTPIEIAPRNAPLPLSYGQQRLWFIDKLGTRDGVYTIAAAVRLLGPLDVAVLERTLDEIVARHESLRTYFIEQDGVPAQCFREAMRLPLEIVDDATDDPAGCARDHARALARRPFDLSRGPLVHARLVRLDEGDHALAVAMHHIVSDGWSLGVFVREMAAIYAALAQGMPAPLAPLQLQYADFARWQRSWLDGGAIATQLAYWRQHLEGAPLLLELPLDRPRPLAQSFNGAPCTVMWPAELIQNLKSVSRDERATLFMTLLAGFGALLSRYSGQDDVVIGTPVANRTRHEVEPLIGFFVNTLPMRVSCSGSPTFRELLSRVRETALGAYAHQDVPFEKLVDALQPERDMARTPIFQVMINMAEFRETRITIPGLAVDSIVRPETDAKFDMTLYVKETPEGARLSLVYNRDLFDAATIELFMARLRRLLEQAAADPGVRVSSIPLLDTAVRERRARNPYFPMHAPFVPFPESGIERSISDRFASQVELHPHRIAIESGSSAVTYAELDKQANRIAHAIIDAGLVPGDRIALLFRHGSEMVAAMFGALKAGLTYVPLDATYPRARLEYMVQDCDAAGILTESVLEPLAHDLAGAKLVVTLDTLDARFSDTRPNCEIDPATPAYILYTSGSTGQPKGVVQSHRNVLHFIRAYTNNLGLSVEDRLLLIASYSFDAAVMDVYGALLNGATLVTYALKEEGIDALPAFIEAKRITVYHSTPTVFRHLCGALQDARMMASVRLVVLGGEEALGRDFEAFARCFSRSAVLVNGLGPTESTVTLQHFMRCDEPPPSHSLSTGFPVDDTDVLLLGADGEDNELFGEIAICSEHVALGYWNRPDDTAASFSASARDRARRIYRTGDLGRRRSDGSIEFAGRRDFQVKVRGHRIELHEIETWLRKHPGVREAVAMTIAREGDDALLAAYVVPASTTAPAPEALREFLAAALPEYMVPVAIVVVDSLPLTPTGKIDRRALPVPELRPRDARDGGPRVSQSPVEEILSGIWCEVLGLDAIGVHERFFDVGGHSLKATQVISRVRTVFGVDVPLRSIFETPTISGLARRIEGARQAPALVAPIPMRRADRSGRLPLSFAQQRLWFIERLGVRDGAYTIAGALQLTGPLDAGALERAFHAVVDRHESLRTVFREQDGVPYQIVLDSLRIPFEIAAYGDEPGADAMELIRRDIRAFAKQPFDIGSGPLIRVKLTRLDANRHVLAVAMHHIVSDGWSLGVFAREIVSNYTALVEGRPAPNEPLAIQYPDFAVWQRDLFQSGAIDAQLEYWKSRLDHVPASIELPLDRPRPAIPSFKGGRIAGHWPRGLESSLREFGRRDRATLFMTMLAAFSALVVRYTGQFDFVIGTPVANRNRSELEPLIGFFVNTLPIRVTVDRGTDFRNLVSVVREASLRAYANQDVPFERLVDELRIERDAGRPPLVQVMFALQNASTPVRRAGPVEISPLPAGADRARFDLTVMVHETADGLDVAFEYARDLFDAETVRGMLDHYELLTRRLLANEATPVCELPILSEAEHMVLLDEWNRTATDWPHTESIQALFEAQVRTRPDAVALIEGDRRLCYRDLNAQANQLARVLMARGVKRDMPVALCMSRSLDMVVAILAILKAGGAYVPIDPSYPAERIAFMLRDIDARVTITLSKHAAELGGLAPEHGMFCADNLGAELRSQPPDGLAPVSQPHDLAYIMYTSGSTGVPKGVCVEHRQVVHFATNPGYVRFDASDIVLHIAPPSFDASTFEIWSPLLNGGTCVICPIPVPSLNDIAGLVETHQATRVFLTTGLFHQMVDGPIARMRSLRQLIAGGDVLSPEHCRRAIRALPDTVFTSAYGPTECTTYTTCQALPDEASVGDAVTLGRPLANVRLYVLDANMHPVPLGVTGELYIGGDGVARGYWRRPDLTQQAFVADSFSSAPGGRLYKTGDLVRYRRDGKLDFVGRLDRQVKIRGFRIELPEIENVLQRQESVAEALVHVQPDRQGVKTLVAYVVPREGHLDAGAVRARLSEKLPAHMVPSAIVMLDSLPLSLTGKVDRNRLPNPYSQDTDVHVGEYVAPSSPTELKVAAVWCDLLGRRRIGAEENFLDIGGHSMMAVQMIARLSQEFGIDIPLRVIFETPTISGLARRIDEIVYAGLDGPGDAETKGGHVTPAELVVSIRGHGSGTPVFLVAPAGGTVFAYYALAHHLGAERPVYALQDPAFDGRARPCATIEEMAALYIEAIKTVQPHGPYAIAGWSFGGNVAFEVAQQLVHAGEAVCALFMIEATAQLRFRKKKASERFVDFKRNFSFNVSLALSGLETVRDGLYVMTSDSWFVRKLRGANGTLLRRVHDIGARALWKIYTRRAKIAEVTSQHESLLLIKQPTTRRWLAIAMANLRAFRRYRPQPYPGRIILFKGEEKRALRFQPDPSQGWEALAKRGCEVRVVPGDHFSCLRNPHVREMGRYMSAYLSAAESAEEKSIPMAR